MEKMCLTPSNFGFHLALNSNFRNILFLTNKIKAQVQLKLSINNNNNNNLKSRFGANKCYYLLNAISLNEIKLVSSFTS